LSPKRQQHGRPSKHRQDFQVAHIAQCRSSYQMRENASAFAWEASAQKMQQL
jgi:hypothetical protein